MSLAYKCEICVVRGEDPYHDGLPAQRLFKNAHDEIFVHTLDVCSDCQKELTLSQTHGMNSYGHGNREIDGENGEKILPRKP